MMQLEGREKELMDAFLRRLAPIVREGELDEEWNVTRPFSPTPGGPPAETFYRNVHNLQGEDLTRWATRLARRVNSVHSGLAAANYHFERGTAIEKAIEEIVELSKEELTELGGDFALSLTPVAGVLRTLDTFLPT
jgi:hypothetical protein